MARGRCVNEDFSSFVFSASEQQSAVDPHPVHRWVGVGAGSALGGLPGPRTAAPGPSGGAGAPRALPPYGGRCGAARPRHLGRAPGSARALPSVPEGSRLPAAFPAGGLPAPPEGSPRYPSVAPGFPRLKPPRSPGAQGGLHRLPGRAPALPHTDPRDHRGSRQPLKCQGMFNASCASGGCPLRRGRYWESCLGERGQI